jgi:23S rRNA (pseudouridine1915-N3)-methyltransferase
VNIRLATIKEKAHDGQFAGVAEFYGKRIQPYAAFEEGRYRTEAALLEAVERQSGRAPVLLVLLDGQGKSMTSRDFAAWLGRQRDAGRRSIWFAIGPADGWSEAARGRADLLLSLGPMTLAHELARLVACEQIYRAFTILAGHPYHTGH